MFIGGRALAGLGASGIVNGAMTILSGAVPREKSPMYTGAILGVGQMGVVSGPLIGGGLTEHATWRWCFYLNLPIGGVVALVLLLIHIPEITLKEKFSIGFVRRILPELDLFGFALFVPPAIMWYERIPRTLFNCFANMRIVSYYSSITLNAVA